MVAKPTCSRNASVESFVVCRGFGRGEGVLRPVERCLDLELEGGWRSWREGNGGVGGLRWDIGNDGNDYDEDDDDHVIPSIVPFVSCGTLLAGCEPSSIPGGFDFMDSDKSYPVEEEPHNDEGENDVVVTRKGLDHNDKGGCSTSRKSTTVLKPLAPPIRPQYEVALAKAKEARAAAACEKKS